MTEAFTHVKICIDTVREILHDVGFILVAGLDI